MAQLLREEIVGYRESWKPVDEAYGIVQEWLTCNPDLTLAQVRRALADEYGLLVTEVGKEARAMKAAWLKESGEETK